MNPYNAHQSHLHNPFCDVGKVEAVAIVAKQGIILTTRLQPSGHVVKARLMMPYVGNGFGASALPRVGDEVMCFFPAGDLSRAVALWGSFNGVDTVPEKTADDLILLEGRPGDNVRIHIRGGVSVEIDLDDELHVHGNQHIQIDGDNDTTIGGRKDLRIGRNYNIEVGREAYLWVAWDSTKTVIGDRWIQQVGNDVETYLSNRTLTVLGSDVKNVLGAHTLTVNGLVTMTSIGPFSIHSNTLVSITSAVAVVIAAPVVSIN